MVHETKLFHPFPPTHIYHFSCLFIFVDISAGSGRHFKLGKGGTVRINAGESDAELSTITSGNNMLGVGGHIELVSGKAKQGRGGSVLVESGFSEGTSSGAIGIFTADAGTQGISG